MRSFCHFTRSAFGAALIALALSACARTPEQIEAHETALAKGRVEYGLTPKLRWEIAQSIVRLAKPSYHVVQYQYDTAEISSLKAQRFGVDDNMPFYCVIMGAPGLFGHEKHYFTVWPQSQPDGGMSLKVTAGHGNAGACKLDGKATQPFPEALAAVNGTLPPHAPVADNKEKSSSLPGGLQRLSLGEN